MAKVLDYLEVSEFEHYYVHIRTYSLRKDMNSLIPKAMVK